MRTGLSGILCYIGKRLSSSANRLETPFDPLFLADYEFVKSKYGNSFRSDPEILAEIMEKLPKEENITNWKYGIENGCAGYGLKCILT